MPGLWIILYNHYDNLGKWKIRSRLYEELGDKNGIGRNLGNIGAVYNYKRDYSKAQEYYFKALKISEELGNNVSIAMILGNIGKTYLEIAKDNNSSKYNSSRNVSHNKTLALQQAKVYTAKAIQILSAIGDLNTLSSNYRGLSEMQALLGDNKGALAAAFENLKATQQQLIQSERMAAFGVMATRMAHEIQNPLNFVNNFSEVSKELVQNILSSHSEEDKKESANLLANNLEKIIHHGNRAADIINQLQKHARAGTAQTFFEDEKNDSL
jgi:signal transduction histidine kinase